MTTPQIEVDLAGTTALLQKVADRSHDLSPVFGGPINEGVSKLFERVFSTQGVAAGQRWRALAPITLLLRQSRGRGRGGIGRDTNRMWASLTKGSPPEGIKQVTKTSLLRGTTVPYARWFHSGYVSRTMVVLGKGGRAVPLRRAKPKAIPGRPLIPVAVPGDLLARWERYIAQYLEAGRAT